MLDRSILDQARFNQDNAALFGFRLSSAEHENNDVRSKFLTRHVKVSGSLFPGIAESISNATGWLLGEKQVNAFISADESINATCLPGPNDLPIIWLSSGLIKTLEPRELVFVIGHELGHWYYQHSGYPYVEPGVEAKFVARQQLARAAEVSADRFGLIACRDLEVSLRATLKTACGLTEQYLGQRVSDFVNQARSIKIENIDHGEVFATHPPMVIRARALLWYSMCDNYHTLTGGRRGGLSLATVNERVGKDLNAVLGQGFAQKQAEEIHDAIFWMAVFELTVDGEFSREDQSLLQGNFGEEALQKLKNLLFGKSKSQVREEIRQRAIGAREAITAYSTQVVSEHLEKYSEIAQHASKFMARTV